MLMTVAPRKDLEYFMVRAVDLSNHRRSIWIDYNCYVSRWAVESATMFFEMERILDHSAISNFQTFKLNDLHLGVS